MRFFRPGSTYLFPIPKLEEVSSPFPAFSYVHLFWFRIRWDISEMRRTFISLHNRLMYNERQLQNTLIDVVRSFERCTSQILAARVPQHWPFHCTLIRCIAGCLKRIHCHQMVFRAFPFTIYTLPLLFAFHLLHVSSTRTATTSSITTGKWFITLSPFAYWNRFFFFGQE